MMLTNRVKRIISVVFLTFLIWVWAYLALEEVSPESGSLMISQAVSPNLLVTFVERETTVPLKLNIKGSTAKMAEFHRRLLLDDKDKDKESLQFFYNPETEGHTESGNHTLNLQQFLNKATKMKRLGLTVEMVEPEIIEIKVEKLVEQMLTVQVVDENGVRLTPESIEPARIKMFVRQDWEGNMLTATVKLTPDQIERARKTSISETPYVELVAGRLTPAKQVVRIKLSSTQKSLTERPVNPVKMGYIFTKNLKDKYSVELLNENDFRTVHVKSTDEAFTAYSGQTLPHLLVEIRDNDENETGEILRDVIYFFPPEYVREKQIEAAKQLPQARLKLVPVKAPSLQGNVQ